MTFIYNYKYNKLKLIKGNVVKKILSKVKFNFKKKEAIFKSIIYIYYEYINKVK